MSFRKTATVVFGGVALAGILVPALVLAQTGDTNQGAKGFCTQLSTISSNIEQRLADRDSKLEAKRAEIQSRIEERRSERDARLVAMRTKWDANRAKHFAKLEERAQTDEQKQAVVAFTGAVNAAIAARRATVDTAIQNFRDGVGGLITSRKTSVDAAITTFKNSVQLALEKAQSDCASGVSPITVRKNLLADLKAAQEKFVSDKQDIEKMEDPTESLIAARKEAIEKAIDDFKATVEQARVDLKAAFPQE